MTPQEFVETGKRKGVPEDQLRTRFKELKASGAFEAAPQAQETMPVIESAAEQQDTPGGLEVGLMDPVHGGAQLLAHGVDKTFEEYQQTEYAKGIQEAMSRLGMPTVEPGSPVEQINRLNNWLAEHGAGIPTGIDTFLPLTTYPEGGIDQQIAEGEQVYQESRRDRYSPYMVDGKLVHGTEAPGLDVDRLFGNVMSPANIAVASRLKPAATLGKRMAQSSALGGYFGGVQPVTEGDFAEEKTKQVALGMATAPLVTAAGSGLSRVVRPQTPQAVQQVMSEGVTPTPGQIMGGITKKAEEAARSVPFLGDAITASHKRGIIEFNRAAINRTLAPIGKKIGKNDPVGYKGVENAYSTIGKAYDDLLPNLKIKADDAFVADIEKIKGMAANMHPSRAKQFENILEQSVLRKFEVNGRMTPETMKEIESQLGTISRKAGKTIDLDQQQLGDAIGEVQQALRKMVERANPKYRGKLKAVNKSYANLLRVENAAARQGAKEGIFTPTQLEAATRAMDSSIRKRASAHGKALMQDLAGAGDTAISNKLANSGTIDRALWNAAGLAIGGGGVAAGVVNPLLPASIAGASAAYIPAVQKGIVALLTRRPALAEPIAKTIRDISPYLAPGAVSAVNTLGQ